jgi:hypothetical protein
MPKRTFTWLSIFIVIGTLLVLFGVNPTMSFTTKTKVIIHPAEEWELMRTIDGNLISVHKNHIKNYIKDYSITEFQRGDAVQFILKPELFNKADIKKGDTIGFVYSNEEQRRLIQLQGQLKILDAELEFHTTGQKPEDVEFAERNLALAEQELETQKKLMARSNDLIKDQVISKEQYDLDLNELKVKELNVQVAKARLASVDTGEKPEMEKLVRSKIKAISMEMDQIQSRLNLFTVLAPISGRISIDHGSLLPQLTTPTSETIVKIISKDRPIGLMPIRTTQRDAIGQGAEVHLSKYDLQGKVVLINSIAQISLSAPYILYVVQFENNQNLTFGETQDVEVTGNRVPFTEYLNLHLNH